MDADRFDAMARALIMTRSRRSLARLLGGGVLAATGLLAVAAPEAAAVRCSRQADCPICYRCTRRGRCRKKRDGATCATIGTCQNGLCEVKRR
jgi:hypothetical protein